MDVVAAMAECGSGSQGLATTQQLLAAGVLAPALSQAVRDGLVVRVHRRVYSVGPLRGWTRYVVTDQGVAPEYVLRVRAALLSLGPGAVAHRRTAAALRGWPLLREPARTVDAAVPHGSRRTALKDVKVTERRVFSHELLTVLPDSDPMAVTTAVQTVVDCGSSLPLLEAVVVCDSALRSKHVQLAELVTAARALPGVTDARRLRRVLELCDPESGSVLETVLRVRMVLAGVSGFATQHVVRNALGARVLRVDFCFAEAGLIVEVDGERWHQDATRDRHLDNRLAVLGWRVLRYRWWDVVHDSERVVAEIREAQGVPRSGGQSQAQGTAAAA